VTDILQEGKKDSYTTIRARMDVVNTIDYLLEHNLIQQYDFRSKNQITTIALKEWLNRLYKTHPNLDPTKGNHIFLGRHDGKPKLEISIEHDGIFCHLCDKKSCVHVDSIFKSKDILIKLLADGYLTKF
jgi:hypothetical protein